MSIKFQILGKPGKDNAVFAWINSGESYYRILIDCGENIFYKLSQNDIKNTDLLLLSHFHIDHIAGFDYLFRRIYDRESKPIIIYGPPNTSKFIQNRLRGYIWNLIENVPGEWIVNDIYDDLIKSRKFYTCEGFSRRHNMSIRKYKDMIYENNDFIIESVLLNHSIPSAAYKITEKERANIDKEKLEELNLPKGSWLEKLKDDKVRDNEKIKIAENTYKVGELRNTLLTKSAGESLVYMTDFIFDEVSKHKAISLANNSDVLICESQYCSDDNDLASKNFHLTSLQAAEIAKLASVKELVLFHISERYRKEIDYPKILNDAQEIFPNTFFPDEW